MIVSEIRLYNFRKFKSIKGNPGLCVQFHKGLNALIGENDSGKTAIIDAIKLVLLTQGNEHIRVSDDDFYYENNEKASEFKIDITLSEFSDNEAKNFVEYLMFEKSDDGKTKFYLYLHFRAWKENNRIYTEIRVGDENDGVIFGGKARELLKCVYLKPLRDAEREMSAGRSSRISQILINHPIFKNTDNNTLKDIISDANTHIEKYFAEDEGKEILTNIRNTLSEFEEVETNSEAQLKTSDIQLKAILESLSLKAPEVQPGLGELNLLFIAAELLLMKHDDIGDIRLLLIEELEAHLHPQAQLRLIQYLQKEYQNEGVQIIISTHSTILASKINIKNIVLLKNNQGFDLSYKKTKLEKGDYLFLQRFLDSSKANLFFAKGIIMVEGDAENNLVPVIADIIGCPLEKHGVSVVNVGSTAFLRYSRIFMREDGASIGIPVSIITDCDYKFEKVEDITSSDFKQKSKEKSDEKTAKFSDGDVKGFVSPYLTFEYCIAMSCLGNDLHTAIHYGKKIKNSDKYSLTMDKILEADLKVKEESDEWETEDSEVKAYKIFKLMLNSDGSSGLKSIVAQVLSCILKWNCITLSDDVSKEKMFDLELYQYKNDSAKITALKEKIENDEYLKYIVDGIKYATGN